MLSGSRDVCIGSVGPWGQQCLKDFSKKYPKKVPHMQSRCLVLSVKTPVLPHVPFYQLRAVVLHETIKDILSQSLWAPTTRSPGLQSVHYVLDLLLERNTLQCPSCCGWLTTQVGRFSSWSLCGLSAGSFSTFQVEGFFKANVLYSHWLSYMTEETFYQGDPASPRNSPTSVLTSSFQPYLPADTWRYHWVEMNLIRVANLSRFLCWYFFFSPQREHADQRISYWCLVWRELHCC